MTAREIKICKTCNTRIEVMSAKMCLKCGGTEFDGPHLEVAARAKYCTRCGASNMPGASMCCNCGHVTFETKELHDKIQSERKGDWQQTYTGRIIYPLDPRPEDIDIRDVAHALSLQCRFAGHSRFHYSVAQHSVLVMNLLGFAPDLGQEDETDVPVGTLELTALLHDASETYLIDVPRPLKRSLPEYKVAEVAWERAVAERYALPFPMPKSVKWADEAALAIERDALFGVQAQPWVDLPDPPLTMRIIERMYPEEVEMKFLEEFFALCNTLGVKP